MIDMPVTMAVRPVHLVRMSNMLITISLVMFLHMFVAFLMALFITMSTIEMTFINTMRLATITLLIHTVFTTTIPLLNLGYVIAPFLKRKGMS